MHTIQEMQAKVKDLEIAYDIHPELFDDYDVKVVPTIIRHQDNKIQKITGHISLRSALEQFDQAKEQNK